MLSITRQRQDYHQRFSCSVEDKLLNFIVDKMYDAGTIYSGVPAKSHIKNLVTKINSKGIKDEIELDEKKIDMKFPTDEQYINSEFLDSEVYTTYLVYNIREQTKLLNDLNEEEKRIQSLLVISPREKRILDQVLAPTLDKKINTLF